MFKETEVYLFICVYSVFSYFIVCSLFRIFILHSSAAAAIHTPRPPLSPVLLPPPLPVLLFTQRNLAIGTTNYTLNSKAQASS